MRSLKIPNQEIGKEESLKILPKSLSYKDFIRKSFKLKDLAGISS